VEAARERLACCFFPQRTRESVRPAVGRSREICFAPVLDLAEPPQHNKHPPHQARGLFEHDGGNHQPAPRPGSRQPPGAIHRPLRGPESTPMMGSPSVLSLDAARVAGLPLPWQKTSCLTIRGAYRRGCPLMPFQRFPSGLTAHGGAAGPLRIR